MKNVFILFILFITVSCYTPRPTNSYPSLEQSYVRNDPPITESLFEDESSTISEENIQKILDGDYTLPTELRVAMVKVGGNSYRNYWTDETYLKSQQAYLDLFKAAFNESSRTERVLTIPDILLLSSPTFTNIREAAVRTQSDVVAIYSITSDIYSNYRLFTKSDIKALQQYISSYKIKSY
ncbi:MAG: hypothetical protein AAF849_01825 [Bacteroidota bacterium]